MLVNTSEAVPLKLIKIFVRIAAKSVGMPFFCINVDKQIIQMREWHEIIKRACISAIVKNTPCTVVLILDMHYLNKGGND